LIWPAGPDLRSINQNSLLLVRIKFNGRRAGLSGLGAKSQGKPPMQARKTDADRTFEALDLILPDPKPRTSAATFSQRPALVEDAVFEIVTPSTLSRRTSNDNPAGPAYASRGRVAREMAILGVGLLRALEKGLGRLSPQAFMTLAGSLCFVVFWLLGGFAAIGSTPTAMTRPFLVEHLFTAAEDANGLKILAVSGALTNQSGTTLRAPELLVVRTDTAETIGSIILPDGRIAPAQSIGFSGRFKLDGGKYGKIAIIPKGA
jgi:hypothetical protein